MALSVYFVSPEPHLNVMDGHYVDMWMAAESAQEAVDLFVAHWDVEIVQPVRVYATSETVSLSGYDDDPHLEACLKGVLSWRDYARLHETTDWTAMPTEHIVPTWHPEPEQAPHP